MDEDSAVKAALSAAADGIQAVGVDPRELLAQWGGRVECRQGWYPLVAATGAAIAAVDPDYRIDEIREKYGELRFFATPSAGTTAAARRRMEAITDAAEEISRTVCETCGAPGSLHQTPRRWLATLCPACAAASGRGYRPAVTVDT
ncbi:hypothetical protein KIH27_02190 [Mycobacterium sp. M1]|uniref:DksA C4-type domain-containing protein n=1 Tax=Mycolicibacter acidiphilus TaxID=2835306 RepID=A0ABS5RDP7_9MYCO|nr:hypothetical protein [Mycolicibacter acidiphilus]MBS9532395.1 hypothetical protein [Mycolicibacter acidiphilus]